jgi:RecA/RadA recombinase
MLYFINQLRDKVGMTFGDPTYTPGGRAIRTNCAIRVRVRRVKGGQLRYNGKVIGVAGIIKNVKNKAGQGSVEAESCGFKVIWNKAKSDIEFMTTDDITDLLKGEKDG